MLSEDNKKCTNCSLRNTCSQVVVGQGSQDARLVIVGEAPGADEDLIGEPFVGRAGNLLRKLLKDANIGVADTYITNAVKCRPPKNRKPTKDEVAACNIWLTRELMILNNVKIIVPLGLTATNAVLQKQYKKMGDIANKFMFSNETHVVPCYHPSYLLQHGRKHFEDTFATFKKIEEILCSAK